MMRGYQDITSENPSQQIWKLLRYFLDTENVSARIIAIHNISDKKHNADIEKQANQIAYCIRQSQEYFLASSNVSLATRPLMLYYGVMSLSTALVLLKQDFDHSLDTLRKKGRHLHHGLVLDKGSLQTINQTIKTEKFLNSVKCRIKTKNNSPYGLFGLFYYSLIPCCITCKLDIVDAGKATYQIGDNLHPCAETTEINSLINTNFNILDLIRFLPDVQYMLKEINIESFLCKGNMKQRAVRHYIKDNAGNEQHIKTVEDTDFFIHNLPPAHKEKLISSYIQKNPNIIVKAKVGKGVHLKHIIELSPLEKKQYFIPDVVDDIFGQIYFIIPNEIYLSEPVSFFILSFCLGMLSRYYPDIWMQAIDKSVRTAELIDSLLNTIFRKFPNLILDQMTEVKHYVHI